MYMCVGECGLEGNGVCGGVWSVSVWLCVGDRVCTYVDG